MADLDLPPEAAERLDDLGLELDEYVAKLTDFVFFVEEIWHDRNLDRFAPITDIERDMAKWAAYGDGTPATRRRGILAPRGIGKSHFIVAALACWHLWKDPEFSHVQVPSKSKDHAIQNLALIRGWLAQVWFLRHLIPTPQDETPRGSKPHRDNRLAIDVGPAEHGRKNPSAGAFGIEGQLEGTRASLVLPDDVETDTNTKTPMARDDLDNRVKEFGSIATFGDREIVYVGTYHHEESVYLKLADPARGYAFRTYPIVAPHPQDRILNLAPIIQEKIDSGELKPSTKPGLFDGDPVFPHRHDRAYIAEAKGEGMTHFAMQQMLVADLGDRLRHPLKLSDLIIHPVNPDRAPLTIAWGMTNNEGRGTRIEHVPIYDIFADDALYGPIMFDRDWAPYIGTKMFIDPAGAGADKTGYAIISLLNGYLWVKAIAGLPGGYSPETLHELARLARDHRATEIIVESNFGIGMFKQLLEPVLLQYVIRDEANPWAASITLKTAKTQKEVRICDTLEPVFNSHRVIVDPRVIDNPALQEQIAKITREPKCLRHEDELDAFAGCVEAWLDSLNIDPEKGKNRHRSEQIMADRRKRAAMVGINIPEPAWYSHN